MSKDVAAIVSAVKNFGKSLDAVRSWDIIELLDSGELVLYTDKYGFIRIVNGYNRQTQQFHYLEAPISYARSKWQTFLHINRLGFQTTNVKGFEDFEYFGLSVKPINGFWRWWLSSIMKVASPHPSNTKQEAE